MYISQNSSSAKIDGFIHKPISLTGQISIIQKRFVKIENDLQQMTMFECPTMNRLEATVIGEGDKRSIRKSIICLISNSKRGYNRRRRILKLINSHLLTPIKLYVN